MLTTSAVTSVATRVGHSSVPGLVDGVIEVQRLAGEHQSAAEVATATVGERQQRFPDPLVGVAVSHANQMSGTGSGSPADTEAHRAMVTATRGAMVDLDRRRDQAQASPKGRCDAALSASSKSGCAG